jgi:hypothetical protein
MLFNLLWRASLALFVINFEINVWFGLCGSGFSLISNIFSPGIDWSGP